MTKEEAIERLNRFKTIKVLFSNTFEMTTEQLEVLQEDIETVLNMLNSMENQEENYKGLIADVSMIAKELGLSEDGTIDEIHERIKQNSAEIEKYKYLYQKALDNTIEADRSNMQLKKQIDLMAEKYNSENQKEVDFSEWNLALEILNIIEEDSTEELKQKESVLDKAKDMLVDLRAELEDDDYNYYAKEVTKILNIIEGDEK